MHDDQIQFEEDNILAVNYPAPDFECPAYHQGAIDKKVALEDYRGKWVVLFFYPLDFTFVCPTELYELSDKYRDFQDLNCEVVAASIDSVHSHLAWAQQDKKIGDIKFPILSDLTKELSYNYGVLHDDGMALRGTFIIDPDGILQSYTVNNLNVGRNADEILRTVKALQTGELCPASWDKGKETLGKA